MSAIKNDNGTWMCKFRYTNYAGERIQKKKMGFRTKKDALLWESEFLASQDKARETDPEPVMTFGSLCDLFLADKRADQGIKERTVYAYQDRINSWLRDAFGNKPVNEITPDNVRDWEIDLTTKTNKYGNKLSQGYMQNLFISMSSIFNYAVRLKGLKENPCIKAGNIIGKKKRSLNFWTESEFNSFIATFDGSEPHYAAFMTLYYTGLRLGELRALTVSDVDLNAKIIHVSKSYKKLHGEDLINEPKTEESNRDIYIPDFLCSILREYISRIYDADAETRIFSMGESTYAVQLEEHCKLSGVKRIRIHDFRHSHASLLINMNCPILLISQRLGHKDISMTLNIYGHLYPSEQNTLADALQERYLKNQKAPE